MSWGAKPRRTRRSGGRHRWAASRARGCRPTWQPSSPTNTPRSATPTARRERWSRRSTSTTRPSPSDPRSTTCGISWGGCCCKRAGPSMHGSTSRSSSAPDRTTWTRPRCSASRATSPATVSGRSRCGRRAGTGGRRIRAWRPISPCWLATTRARRRPAPASSRPPPFRPTIPRLPPRRAGEARGRSREATGVRVARAGRRLLAQRRRSRGAGRPGLRGGGVPQRAGRVPTGTESPPGERRPVRQGWRGGAAYRRVCARCCPVRCPRPDRPLPRGRSCGWPRAGGPCRAGCERAQRGGDRAAGVAGGVAQPAARQVHPARRARRRGTRRHGGGPRAVAQRCGRRGQRAHCGFAAVRLRDGRRAGARVQYSRARVRERDPPPARARYRRRGARGAGAVRPDRGPAAARRRQARRRRGLVPARLRAGVPPGCGARRVPGLGGREAGARRHSGCARELPAGDRRRHARRHDRAAGARENQRGREGRRAVDHAPEIAVRTLTRLRLVTLLGLVACHHAPKVTPASQPELELARARRQFHSGDFAHAQISLRRLTFELGPAQPELVEVRYDLAECYFQTGDRVQAAHEFRQVADQYPTSEYAPLALLRAGDANLRLWRRPKLDPTYGQSALAIYQELAGRYPGTTAAARAQRHVQQLREWFAEKDYKNGLFYLKRRAFDSAIIYFKDVIATYPGTPRVPDALLRLVDSYRGIGYTDELKETCTHLRRFYPQARGLDESCPADSSTSAPSTPSPS